MVSRFSLLSVDIIAILMKNTSNNIDEKQTIHFMDLSVVL